MLGSSGKPSLTKLHLFFRKYFFVLLIIPVILMGVGLTERISQYGVTESRYVNTLVLLWLCIEVIHFFIRAHDKLVRFMLATASAILILGSVGPWGVESASAYSQLSRLQTLLEQNHILVNEDIKKNFKNIPTRSKDEIQSIVSYLIHTGKIKPIKKRFGIDGEKHLRKLLNSNMEQAQSS